jgi:Cu-processing system permease protein
MSVVAKIMRYELRDVMRSRWLVAYTLFFIIVTDGLLRFTGGGANAELALLNIVLVIIPLVSIVFGAMHLYNAREFTEVLLAQPLGRRQLFAGLYFGLALPLSLAFVIGVGVPFALRGFDDRAQFTTLATLLGIGFILTLSFTGLAFALALRLDDKARGLAAAIALWLLTTVLYDGFVLVLGSMFAAYPLERPLIAMMMLNPVDLGRVLLLLQLDVSALMGYTGASLQRFVGTMGGITFATSVLLVWAAAPSLLAARLFRRKDF